MPRKKPKLELTLFPFLSVLAGMIAVMMLFMMLTLSTRVIGDDAADRKQASRRTKATESLTLPGAGQDTLDDARYDQLRKEIVQLSGVLADRKRQHDELALAVDQLEGLLEAKKNEVEVVGVTRPKPGRKIGQPMPVSIVPIVGGHVIDKKAHYVEVDAEGYVLFPAKQRFPPVVRRGGPGKDGFTVDPGLAKFLADINVRRKTEFVVFLIHPNGAGAFVPLRQYIDAAYPFREGATDQFDVGWEPFSRDWQLLTGTQ